jgi:hypothetical protein
MSPQAGEPHPAQKLRCSILKKARACRVNLPRNTERIVALACAAGTASNFGEFDLPQFVYVIILPFTR